MGWQPKKAKYRSGDSYSSWSGDNGSGNNNSDNKQIEQKRKSKYEFEEDLEYNKQRKNKKYEFKEDLERENINKKDENNLLEFPEKIVKFVVDTAKDIVSDIKYNYEKTFKEDDDKRYK